MGVSHHLSNLSLRKKIHSLFRLAYAVWKMRFSLFKSVGKIIYCECTLNSVDFYLYPVLVSSGFWWCMALWSLRYILFFKIIFVFKKVSPSSLSSSFQIFISYPVSYANSKSDFVHLGSKNGIFHF